MRRLTTEEFIKKAKEIHGDKYDYSKVNYIDAQTKVCIICPIHGEFWVKPNTHLNGKNCLKCSHNYRPTTEEWIARCVKRHGDRYDYSKVEYKRGGDKVCIICPEHGEFWQIANNHERGAHCPKCSRISSSNKNRKTTDEFIKNANEKHNHKYDYSKVVYRKGSTKVCIICPKHGEFWQTPTSHLNGCGCPECANKKKKTTEEFINSANKKHNYKYDYTKTVYVNKRSKVVITCPIHGDFIQCAGKHILGQGCPECGKMYAKEYRQNDYKSFVSESNNRFPNLYSFPDIEKLYTNSHSKIKIVCNKCKNEFIKIACDHLTSPHGGCIKCYCQTSKNEMAVGDYLKTIMPDSKIVFRERSILENRELDIYLPENKIGIEYNGLFWHCEAYKPKYYHLDKLNLCNEKGIKLIQIFEDEYVNKKEIVHNKLKHILGITDDTTKIMARKCKIVEINKNVAKLFLDENHIQCFSSSTVYLGAYYDEMLIGVMSFKRETKTSDKWELTRYATKLNTICQGLGSKLFTHFIRLYKPSEVKSFADRRWTIDIDNNLYTKIGFKLDKILRPDYHYIKSGVYERFHKFNFRKQILHKKHGFPLTMTETEMAKELKVYKIYDCGLLKYVWKNLDI